MGDARVARQVTRRGRERRAKARIEDESWTSRTIQLHKDQLKQALACPEAVPRRGSQEPLLRELFPGRPVSCHLR